MPKRDPERQPPESSDKRDQTTNQTLQTCTRSTSNPGGSSSASTSLTVCGTANVSGHSIVSGFSVGTPAHSQQSGSSHRLPSALALHFSPKMKRLGGNGK